MKIAKRIFIILAVFLIVLLGTAILVPIIFKDQLIEAARTQINNNVNAEVDFQDAEVSFLRSFPDISLKVDQLEVIGVDTFAGRPLARIGEATVDIGFWSVVKGENYRIKGVHLVRPDLNIIVMPSGLANYDIALPSDEPTPAETEPAAEMNFTLDEYSITDGRLVYDDRATETYMEMTGLNHSGSGDFTLEEFDLLTETTADKFTLSQGGVPYLNAVRAVVDAGIHINTATSTYSFRDATAKLNELNLTANGSIAMPGEDIDFDMDFTAPGNDFRELWSMIPAAYTEGYENIKTTGDFQLAGSVQGPFNSEREVYPRFQITAAVNDGSVQYPDLPVGIEGIGADIRVNSPSSNLNDLTVDVSRLNLIVGGDPFNARFRLRTPLSDPAVDARLEGLIDLAKWTKAFPVEGVEEAAGRIEADLTLDNVRQSALESGNYGDLRMDGNLTASNIVYKAADMPRIGLVRAEAQFDPKAVSIPEFTATLGRSDLAGNGRIDNILAYFSPEQTMRGTFDLRSNYFLADEWIPAEEAAPAKATPAEMAEAEAVPAGGTEIFDRFDFTVNAQMKEIDYDTYKLKNSRVAGNIKPNRIEVTDMGTTMGSSSFSGTGTILNGLDYAMSDGVLGGKINIRSGFIDLADFMSEEAEAAATAPVNNDAPPAEAAVPIPDNINMTVNFQADRVKYTDMLIDNMRGDLVLRDRQAIVQNGTANLLGGAMAFEGAYDTSEPNDPGFRVHYDLKSIDFGQAFNTLNTFAALAPIGKFIQGNFNSDMVMEGKLGADLLPKLNSIDAKGFLSTIDAKLAGFKPLEKVAQALHSDRLGKAVDLKNLKSWFTIKDGTVAVEPFDVKVADARMTVAGRHGLSQDMDYNLRVALPRAMIEGNAAGAAVGKGLDFLSGQASRLGLNVAQGDTLNFNVGLVGTIANPKTNFNLIGTSGKGGSGIVDSTGIAGQITGQVKDQIAAGKEQVKEGVTAVKDSVRSAVSNQIQAGKEQARDQVRDAVGGLLGTRDTTRRDSTATPVSADGLKKEADKIKDEIGKFNPFKKKKDGGR